MQMILPASYAVIEEEEMMYLDGGANGWWNSVGTVSRVIDLAVVFIPGIKAVKSARALSNLLKSSARQTLTRTLNNEIRKLFGSTAVRVVGIVLNSALALVGSSLGQLVARGIDRFDSRPNNGYLFG